MHLRRSCPLVAAARVCRSRRVLVASLLAATLLGTARLAHTQTSPAVDGRPGTPAVRTALEAVRADPNMGTQRKLRTLRWRGPSVDSSPPALPAWLRRLTEWTARSARYLVWLAAIAGAALLAGYLVRVARDVDGDTDDVLSLTPSHVRDLDIRPESLPADIGGTARALWTRGEQRAALALLYRGALSRLVHVHHVPIRDSSTEGDCLRLSATSIEPGPHAFVAGLIRVWQRSVYGHQPPQDAQVFDLCAEFDRALPRRAAQERESPA